MDKISIKNKLLEFAKKLEKEEINHLITILNSVTEIASVIAELMVAIEVNSNLKSNPIVYEQSSDIDVLYKLFENREYFKSNLYLSEFLKKNFEKEFGKIEYGKCSRKEIAQRFYFNFRKIKPGAPVEEIIKKITNKLPQADYGELFKALTKRK